MRWPGIRGLGSTIHRKGLHRCSSAQSKDIVRVCSRHAPSRPLACAPALHWTRARLFGYRSASTFLNERTSRASEPGSQQETDRARQVTQVDDPTIYALSTAPGRAAIAIVRCSGSLCKDIYRALCPDQPLPKPRMATLRPLHRPATNDELDKSLTRGRGSGELLDPGALALYFPAPNTVTGEDVIEFQVHGGPATVRAVLESIPLARPAQVSRFGNISMQPLIRYAEPGEFTRRAFSNARLSLAQVEALSATLSAETTQQHRAAMAAVNGAAPLSLLYEGWQSYLVAARGELEALIDFAEDQAFGESPEQFLGSVHSQIVALHERLLAHSAHAGRGELLREGITVALLGEPNAGKSSLLNAVVGRAAAIVSSEPGTTRDVLGVSVDIGGYAFRFEDTAGLRSHSLGTTSATDRPLPALGAVEQEGIRRAKARAREAQIVIAVIPFEEDGSVPVLRADIAQALMDLDLSRQRLLIALNKVDLLPSTDSLALHFQMDGLLASLPDRLSKVSMVPISCRDDRLPQGVQPLLQELLRLGNELTRTIPDDTITPDEVLDVNVPRDEHKTEMDKVPLNLGSASLVNLALGISERQHGLLDEACGHLKTVINLIGLEQNGTIRIQKGLDSGKSSDQIAGEIDVVLIAEHLRGAAKCLASMSGKGESGDVEEVLGIVFEKFCVGK